MLDLAVAFLMLMFLAPLLALTALLIWASGDGPVLFSHPRIGRNGRLFSVYKFRTMQVGGDAILARHLTDNPAAQEEWIRCHKLREDPRVSSLGRLLRASSIDELPQLFNVLHGSMSIVGPRPIVAAEAYRYGSNIDAYCSVRPGITGLWQVSGRSELSYAARVELDADYARRKSIWLDLKLIVATLPAVLTRRGSY